MTRHAMAPGCCSAVEPCSHQCRDPTTICALCQAAGGMTADRAPTPAVHAAPRVTEASPWRQGRHYPIHVYEGDRPVATFLREEDAARCVAALGTAATPGVEPVAAQTSTGGEN